MKELADIGKTVVDTTQTAIESGYATLVASLVSKVIPDLMGKTYKGLRSRYAKADDKERIDRAFSNYLTTVLETVGYIKTINNKDTPLQVNQIFVETKLITSKKRKISSDNIGELLKLNPAFVQINGVGGIGKTTILKQLFVKVLEQNVFVPVFIELRKVNSYVEVPPIETFVYESMKNKGLDIEYQDFMETLPTGKYVFFFDGFDEVKQGFQSFVFDKINDMRSRYTNNHYFTSSRELELMQTGWSTSNILRVSPFTKEQAVKFVGKVSNIPEEVSNQFINEMDNSEFFKKYESFITNPLLLSIMLMTYQRFATIPGKLHLFYDSAFSTLYQEHDAMKDGYRREKMIELSGIAQDDFEKILESFSFHGYMEKKNTYENKTDLITTVEASKKALSIIYDGDSKVEDFKVSDFIKDISDGISLIVRDGDEYRYIHRSFQEYFSAKYITLLDDELQKEFLNGMYLKDFEKFYSDEFFPMLYDLSQRQTTKNFILPKLKEFFENISKDELKNFIEMYYEDTDFYNDLIDYSHEYVRSWLQVNGLRTEKIKVNFSREKNKKEKSIVTILRKHYPNYKEKQQQLLVQMDDTSLKEVGTKWLNVFLTAYGSNKTLDNKFYEDFESTLSNQSFYSNSLNLINSASAELSLLHVIVTEFETRSNSLGKSVFDSLF